MRALEDGRGGMLALDSNAPLFSLPVADGAGALLAAAAGDAAGGRDSLGYSALTQVSTVLAYHLLRHGTVDARRLVEDLLVLDGSGEGARVYRGASASFRSWLKTAHRGIPIVSVEPSCEPAARVMPIGIWHRREPTALITASTAAAGLTHRHGPSVLAAVAVSGAVAGSCYAQVDRDLVYAAAETAERALAIEFEDVDRFDDMETARALPGTLRSLAPLVAATPRDIVRAVSTDNGPIGTAGALLGILLGASRANEPVRLIEAGAMSGGSEVGAIVGAIVGARSGLVRWPWRVPNDTWFAEIGRRLVTRNTELGDMPIPYAVEERVLKTVRPTLADETL